MAHILVIDDDEDTRITLSALLEELGYEASFAKDGDAGIEFHRRAHFDLVMVDLGLPGKSGIQTTKEILREFPDARVIAMSGTHADELVRAKEEGAFATLAKPLQYEEVENAIGSVMRISRGWEGPVV
jgi:two-component system response regulator (stage 0 sporulation protein F)